MFLRDKHQHRGDGLLRRHLRVPASGSASRSTGTSFRAPRCSRSLLSTTTRARDHAALLRLRVPVPRAHEHHRAHPPRGRAYGPGAAPADAVHCHEAQAAALMAMEELTDITCNSISGKDKIIASRAVDAIKDFALDYLGFKARGRRLVRHRRRASATTRTSSRWIPSRSRTWSTGAPGSSGRRCASTSASTPRPTPPCPTSTT